MTAQRSGKSKTSAWGLHFACLLPVTGVVAFLWTNSDLRHDRAKERAWNADVAQARRVAQQLPAGAGAVCGDGWISPSGGRGTCSHHGGVALWAGAVREEASAPPAPTPIGWTYWLTGGVIWIGVSGVLASIMASPPRPRRRYRRGR